ncbi:uncharacterized protein LOC111356429 [Spodoptera litura]|uniref:Uncharacterized protein LOC111356429 n=1 Tax=Spodoptera litura TaxID=69820 RepID=A0A9J7ITD8_SPOLT|nr:uncharacterized protein LOC111356429 [Spodoptera litura]
MERNNKVLEEISIPTSELKIKSIQDLLKLSKESSGYNEEFWNQVADNLWSHLQIGFKTFDDQLLCATCFYTVLPCTEKQDTYLTELLHMIEEELSNKNKEESSSKTYNVVSMMYGIFQSTFLIQKTHSDVIKSVLKPVFDLLLLMGYEYSQYTFISFKTMKLFKKVLGTDFQECIFSKERQIKLLNFINHNWENPVTGIRDLNRSVFQTLLTTLDDEMYQTVMQEINSFYWNKAKYLMLSEVIEYKNAKSLSLLNENKWVDGLTYSLHKPGLVSAGADMYYALLKQIDFEKDWCTVFLNDVIKILIGSSGKAIENFHNFWCLITMKKFPNLHHILLEELRNHDKTEQNLCSQLCIMKQANRKGLLEKNWKSPEDFDHIEKTVLIGLDHCNAYIRTLAFDIVCVSQGKVAPSQLEYDLILEFIHNNINSDCTVLRLSMLNSLNIFLTQLHSTFLNVMIKDESNESLQNRRILLEFCTKLQNSVITSINLNGNYQRKITCVKLCSTIISCFSEIPNKRRGQIRNMNMTLIEYVKEKECWVLSTDDFVLKLISLLKDPTDDVRENVVKLLLNHYSEELKNPNINQHLVNGALKSMRSKFFYEISCGQSMFKLITNLVIKHKHSIGQYKNVEDIFYFAYNELISEHKAKTNIMKSIEMGKQLHSFMNILLVVLETCIANSYKIDINGVMSEFVEVLESISNQFAWEEDSSTSSDFSKMSDMVENIIDNSGLTVSDEIDETKISGFHQIVLNSLWLNVKASCDLSSLLVQLNVDNDVMAEKCLNIITHVLETSRHKGAIEAAGASLGKGIQFLTSLPEEYKASEVPNTLLKCKLNDLISETNKMASITRRGAGLSIMVHRIVSSDMKKGKPLFHYFINTLLDICNSTKDTPKRNDENQIDLPKAIYIHFLTRIVTDSGLASDMMFYFAKLAELAFGNLTSAHWQIRNAALQLYGALIPKQIGEKKASGSDEQTTATVACDELRTHSPKLWKYIMQQLKLSNQPDMVQSHSNLVPILNLLANSAKRYNFSFDMQNQETADEDLLKCLLLLLNSPIHTVRRLTAKCIFNIYDVQKICSVLLNHVFLAENDLHGSLILLSLCQKYYVLNEAYKEEFKQLKHRFEKIFSSGNHSYLSKTLFEDIFINSYILEDMAATILEIISSVHLPGVDLWAEARMKKYIKLSEWNEIPNLLQIILKLSNYEKYCEFILIKVKEQKCSDTDHLLNIVDILLSFEKKYYSSITWKIIYDISLQTDLSNHLDIAKLLKVVEERQSVYIIRFMIPLMARNIMYLQKDGQLSLVQIIRKLSNFEISDVDMRYIAAIANNELANEFDNLPDSVKVITIKCAIMLLQDEDEDVRNKSVLYYCKLSKQERVIQPYICLNNILNRQFLYNKLNGSQHSMNELVKELSNILQSNHNIDEYNPFANDSKNIYLEPDVLKQLIKNLKTP